MKARRVGILLCTSILCTSILGCAAFPETRPPAAESRVRLLDSELADTLLTTVSRSDTDDRRLRVIVKFRNRRKIPVHLWVRTLFKSPTAGVLNADAEWQAVLLPENGLYAYEIATTEYEATDFEVQVKGR